MSKSKDIVIKRKIRVTITKEIEVTLSNDVESPELQEAWKKDLWHIDGVDDIAKYAAEMAAIHGSGYEHDGIGLLGYSHIQFPRKPDAFFELLHEDTEVDLIGDCE